MTSAEGAGASDRVAADFTSGCSMRPCRPSSGTTGRAAVERVWTNRRFTTLVHAPGAAARPPRSDPLTAGDATVMLNPRSY